MSNYLDNQFLTYSPCTLTSTAHLKVKITSERGSTNWLNIDPTAAREIEEAIEGAYKRREALANPTAAHVHQRVRNLSTGAQVIEIDSTTGRTAYDIITNTDVGTFKLYDQSGHLIKSAQHMDMIEAAAIQHHINKHA